MKSVLTPLAKSILIPLGLIVAASSATDVAIQKKILGCRSTLVFLNEEIDDIIKIVKSLEGAGLLIKWSKIFLGVLAAVLGNNLGDKGVIQVGEGINRVSQDF